MNRKQTKTAEYSSYLLRVSSPVDGGRPQFQLQNVLDKSVRRFTDPFDLMRFIMNSAEQQDE